MGYISSFFNDPVNMLIVILLAMPGRLLALSAHEFSHAYVADRCGDHTARYLGRLTLNPIKHIDPIGFIMMLLVGFGWAKPVPVNPLKYRNYRRDDLLVSIAGVTMNFILFILSAVVMYAIIGIVLSAIAAGGAGEWEIWRGGGVEIIGTPELGYYHLQDVLRNPSRFGEIIISPIYGKTWGYLFTMLGYFVDVNIILAAFNLLPIPPLDGYHVLNDLFLKRPLFASPRATQIASGIFLVLMFTGVTGRILSWVYEGVFHVAGMGAEGIFSALGIF